MYKALISVRIYTNAGVHTYSAVHTCSVTAVLESCLRGFGVPQRLCYSTHDVTNGTLLVCRTYELDGLSDWWINVCWHRHLGPFVIILVWMVSPASEPSELRDAWWPKIPWEAYSSWPGVPIKLMDISIITLSTAAAKLEVSFPA